MSTHKPTLILLPGAWHPPTIYNTMISQLNTHGYTRCTALPLLAVDHDEPAVQSLEADISALRRLVATKCDAGHEVVVIAHSWSGLIASSALTDLSLADRQREGKEGGVTHLVFLSAFVPPSGTSLIDAFGGTPPPWYAVDESQTWVLPRTPEAVFYNDLPEGEAKHWAGQLKRHSYATKFCGGTGEESWKRIHSTYVVCEEDQAIPVVVQEGMVEQCRGMGAEMGVVRVKSGHSPMLSVPEEVVRVVRRAAGEEGV